LWSFSVVQFFYSSLASSLCNSHILISILFSTIPLYRTLYGTATYEIFTGLKELNLILYNLTLGLDTKDSCWNRDISGGTLAWRLKKYGSISINCMNCFLLKSSQKGSGAKQPRCEVAHAFLPNIDA
jgi:hypothetical protein